VVHIATLHCRSDRWIDVQLRYLERHTDEPYRVYACLDWIDRRHFGRFHFTAEPRDTIAAEFNLLAEVIADRARPDDPLVFMHGDTFPIAEWVTPVREMLARHPLAGVRRDENVGEPHPHACFTATTPRFWSEIGGDWSRGPKWTGTDGRQVTDLGAVLWRNLEERGVDWHPILRTNTVNPHPLWFGVYGDIVYHHGAAFRKPMSRVDASKAPPKRHVWMPARFVSLQLTARRSARIGERMFQRLRHDDGFYRELVG